MPKEIELKYLCSDKEVTAIKNLNGLTSKYFLGPPYPFETHDTYLDTEDQFLLNQGASLRCRRKNERLKVTLKKGLVQKGHQIDREEVEEEVSLEAFEALLHQGVPPPSFRPMLYPMLEGRVLRPVLEVQNDRQVREVFKKTGTTKDLIAEISLDRGVFIKGTKQAPFYGIEIEMKGAGTPQDLDAIAGYLKSLFPNLEPDEESKYQKGMKLIKE